MPASDAPTHSSGDVAPRGAIKNADPRESVEVRHERRIARSRKHWRFEVSDESEEWVISYMDMVTLMMCAFVVIAALLDVQSSHAAKDLSEGARGVTAESDAVSGIQIAPPPSPIVAAGAEGGSEQSGQPADNQSTGTLAAGSPDKAQALLPSTGSTEGSVQTAAAASTVPPPSPEEAEANAKFEEAWRQAISAQGLGDRVSIAARGRSVTIQIQDEILFTTGEAELGKGGQDVIRRLEPLLAKTQGDIRVEGYTDNVPIGNERFASNWELSAGRATSVVRALIDTGIPPARLRATGYADTRPVASNDTDVGRAHNRRVSLIIER